MGDKTQLATFGLASQDVSKWTVFFAASLALICATAIGVLAGSVISKYIPVQYIRIGAGSLFIIIGIITIIKSGS